MKRAIITINKSGNVNIPNGNIGMSEMEMVELFGVLAPTLRAAINSAYMSRAILCSLVDFLHKLQELLS